MTEEERQRIVAAGLSKFKFMQPKTLTPEEKLVATAQTLNQEVLAIVRPVIEAQGTKDTAALRQLMAKLYVERFAKLSKDELENLCTILHVEIAFESLGLT